MAQQALAGRKQDTGPIGLVLTFIKKYWIVYALVLPAVLFRFAFTAGPLLRTMWLSFTDKSLQRDGKFIGLENYAYMFKDAYVQDSIDFTVIYTVTATVLQVVLGLGMALLLNQNLKAQWFSRVANLLPWAAAPIVAGIMWRLMFFEGGGVLNDLVLRFDLHSERVMWLSDGKLARVSVIVTTLWKNSPWCALVLLAGLKTIPVELMEAAQVDGANVWARFIHITLPLLMPIILVVFLFRGMGEVGTFDQILGLTRGGPGSATEIISLYAFDRFFQHGRYGYGSALVMLLFLLTFLIGGFFALLLYRRGQD
ncbi:MAG: sugar ABC transporter permease [Caldilineaceae bacterium]|nr:sugar ABC transporter permease [Caldilineaceae bacterium]